MSTYMCDIVRHSETLAIKTEIGGCFIGMGMYRIMSLRI